MKQNVAGQFIGAQMVSATDGSAFTSAVVAYVTGDAGTQAVGSVGAGACTHEGNGFHTYAPAQAETNYGHIGFTFIGTGAVPATVQVYTMFPQTGDNFARLGAPAGASVSADIAAVKVDTAAVKVKTDFLPSATAGAAGGLFIAGTNAATAITTALTANVIGNVTGNLSGSVGSVTGAVGSVTGAVGSVTGAVGSVTGNVGGNVVGTVASVVGAVGSVTGAVGSVTGLTASNLDVAVSTLATAANLATLTGFVDTEVAAILAAVDTEVAAILADTNELQTDWANGGRLDNILDARASQASVDDLPTNAELATALGTADDAVLTQVATANAVLAKLDDTLEDAGTDGFIFSAVALSQAPTGGTAPTASEIADEVETRTIAAVTVVNGLAANVITAAAAAADFTTEITAGVLTAIDALPTNAELATALGTADDAVLAQLALVKAQTDLLPSDPADQSLVIAATNAIAALIGTPAGASVAADVAAIKVDTAAIRVYPDRTVIRGTVSATAPTTTSLTTSAINVAGAAVDQFKGRIIIFDNATTTVELRGQATDITANTDDANPLLTFTALTDAPAAGDTFSIV